MRPSEQMYAELERDCGVMSKLAFRLQRQTEQRDTLTL